MFFAELTSKPYVKTIVAASCRHNLVRQHSTLDTKHSHVRNYSKKATTTKPIPQQRQRNDDGNSV